MNKISKKIVALVTMAAFVLTLVPAAAFAAVDTNQTGTSFSVSATTAGTAIVTVNLKDDGGSTATLSGDEKVRILVDGGNTAKAVEAVGTTAAINTASHANVETLANTGVALSDGEQVTYSNLTTGTHTFAVEYTEDGKNWTPLKTTDTVTGNIVNVENNVVTVDVDAAASVNQSRVVVDGDESSTEVSVDIDAEKTMKFEVRDRQNNIIDQFALNAASGTNDNVYVWAETESGQLVDGVVFGDGTGNGAVQPVKEANAPVWKITSDGSTAASVKSGNHFTATFDTPGTYYIYAGVSSATSVNAGATVVDALGTAPQELQAVKVVVGGRSYETASFTLSADVNGSVGNDITPTGRDTNFELNVNDGVTPSGVKSYTVSGTAYTASGVYAQGEELNLSVNKNGLNLSTEKVTTDAYGHFEFSFTLTKAGEYTVSIAESEGDATAKLKVIKNSEVSAISTTKDGGKLLAGTDKTYADNTVGTAAYFADGVQFEVTDSNGNAVAGASDGAELANYSINVTAPEDSDVDTDAFKVVWSDANEAYTLEYDGDYKDLVAGDYTVKVALNNSSKAATATFTLAEFGEAQELAIDFDNNVTDKVTLAQTVSGTVKLVDANGLKVAADSDVAISINGAALKAANSDPTINTPNFNFTLPSYSVDNEAFYGTTVTVTAFDKDIPDTKTATLTVVADETNYDLAFDSTQGVVDTDNEVGVSVVDADGNVVKDVDGNNTTLYAYLVSQSNENAKVSVAVDTDNLKDGKGALTVYADQATDVEIAVVVYDERNDGHAIYAGNLKYTVGEKDANADTTVVMTIGSSDLVVNNKLVAGDAAPYVADSRTMVPIRVLTESFGAEVNYDNDARTVTIKDGDTTVVMTIGETTYTVNGEEKTMDVAPVIGSGDRAYVPVRFAAEALGYEVTPLYAADGTTASVLFQK